MEAEKISFQLKRHLFVKSCVVSHKPPSRLSRSAGSCSCAKDGDAILASILFFFGGGALFPPDVLSLLVLVLVRLGARM